LRPALDLPGRETGYRRVLKFRRSWIAVIVLAAFDVVFLVPSITTFQQAVTEWSGINSLFDLVGAVFLTAWLMGWSIGPLLMTGILLLLLFGREVIMVRNGRLVIFVGIPVLGVEMEYSIPAMRNLRFNKPIKSSGKAWRGPHMLFDYGANMIAVGSQLSGDEMIDIKHHIQDASGQAIRRGEATEAELADHWEPAQKEAIKTSNRISPAPANMTHEPLSLSSPSTLALVFANLVPLAGATLLGRERGNRIYQCLQDRRDRSLDSPVCRTVLCRPFRRFYGCPLPVHQHPVCPALAGQQRGRPGTSNRNVYRPVASPGTAVHQPRIIFL